MKKHTFIKMVIFYTICALTCKTSISQNYRWAIGIGGTDYDNGQSITYDATGNVYVTGRFRETVDFDPGPGTANLISTMGGTSIIFFAKYGYLWLHEVKKLQH